MEKHAQLDTYLISKKMMEEMVSSSFKSMAFFSIPS